MHKRDRDLVAKTILGIAHLYDVLVMSILATACRSDHILIGGVNQGRAANVVLRLIRAGSCGKAEARTPIKLSCCQNCKSEVSTSILEKHDS